MLNIGGLGSGGSELGLIGLPMMSWSPIVIVKSPTPGACAPEFTVGFPKPRSANHVAASIGSENYILVDLKIKLLLIWLRGGRVESVYTIKSSVTLFCIHTVTD